jgi:hypothetical protein
MDQRSDSNGDRTDLQTSNRGEECSPSIHSVSESNARMFAGRLRGAKSPCRPPRESYPNHCGLCHVPSKSRVVLKGSYLPCEPAAAVLESGAESSGSLRGLNVRAANRPWFRRSKLSQPLITTEVGRWLGPSSSRSRGHSLHHLPQYPVLRVPKICAGWAFHRP